MAITTDLTANTSEGEGKNTAVTEGTGTQTVTTEAKTFTQDQLNEIVTSRLAEQKKKLSTQFETDLAAKIAAAVADRDAQIETTVNERVTAELTKKALESAKAKIKDEYSLTDKQLEKLDGDTESDLRASADALFGAMKTRTAPVIVTGGNGGNNDPQTFSRSQLKDFTFYQKHKDAILLAQREGRITED